MRIRRLILTFLVLGALSLGAQTASAQGRFSFKLPSCERTVYTIQNRTVSPTQEQTISPEEYDARIKNDATFSNTWKVTEVTTTGICGYDDFFQLFASAASWGLSILAVVAVFFFIWGGFTLLISGGRSEKVEEGKKILSGTFLGVLVVLTSWIIVNAYIAAFTGSTQGFIFPKVPGLTRPGLGGGGNECRAAFKTQYAGSQAGCDGSDLHLGCADPTTSDGAVTRLQELLTPLCPSVGTVDGCFGKNTAFALWSTLSANGYTSLPAPDRYQDVRAGTAILRLLASDFAEPCAAVHTPSTKDPTLDDGATTGCCVPGEGRGFSCLNPSASSTCPLDNESLPEAQRPGYQFVPNLCNTISACTTTCCMKYLPNNRRQCETCEPSRCTAAGAFSVQGPCPFASGTCTAATLCS